jgi:rhamnulokinase
VLYDEHGLPMSPVWCYRDPRTAVGVETVRDKVDWPATYAETGIQFMALNTLYQIVTEPAGRLAQARHLLLIGDAFNYFCSGVARNEVSLASTTQLYNPVQKRWSQKLFSALGLREDLFAPICPGGTVLGPMKAQLAAESGLAPMQVIASCSHDTAAAVAAVPASGENWAYLSSGTWSLMGVEKAQPVINEQSRKLGFTNEIGYGDTVRLLKNIIGLWLIQESRRHWIQQGKKFEFAELAALAADAPPFVSLINPDDPRFLSPGGMPDKIADFCRETGQPAPASIAACVRCIYESLALSYRATLRKLERLVGNRIDEPIRGQRHQRARARRPGRMHRAGQHSRAGHRAGAFAVARRRAGSRPKFLRAENLHPAKRGRMGCGRRAVCAAGDLSFCFRGILPAAILCAWNSPT